MELKCSVRAVNFFRDFGCNCTQYNLGKRRCVQGVRVIEIVVKTKKFDSTM